MSAVIKTTTPFVIEAALFKALETLKSEPQLVSSEVLRCISQRNEIQTGDILTNRSDYNGRQFFRQQGERWVLLHDSDEYSGRVVSQLTDRRYTSVNRFLAEQERIRLEEERRARVENTRQQAIAKAKAQGYSVKESRTASGQIQLVLTRTV
jgi:glycosidase